MSVKYEGELSVGRKCKFEFLANNEFNLSNRNRVRMVTLL